VTPSKPDPKPIRAVKDPDALPLGPIQCKRCGVGEWAGLQRHHVVRRGLPPGDVPENLVWVCVACHEWVHRHPRLAYQSGLLQHGGAE
jgi:heterodisulfide reductase subunit C